MRRLRSRVASSPGHVPAPRGALAAVCLAALALAAMPAVEAQLDPPQKARLELFSDRASYAPGDEVRIGARVTVDEGWHIQSDEPTYDYLIPTELRLALPTDWKPAEIAFPEHHMWQGAFTEEPIAVFEAVFTIVAGIELPADQGSGTLPLEALLRYQACDDRSCLPPTETVGTVALEIGERGAPQHGDLFVAGSGAGGAVPAKAEMNLALVLLFGFLGGLILNAMPCVLPVVSLKVFALVRHAGDGPARVRAGALATGAGILVSFLALGGAAIAAKLAGEAVGWGIQFQNSAFVIFLLLLVVLFCLNLWGLFEVRLPGPLAQLGSRGHHQTLGGHFATGLFATLMATPCSAPFLGPAMGFGLTQSTGVVFLLFFAAGLGMASPYLLLAAKPGAARWLPKPGAWMEHVRHAMGFLLAGAAVWLLYVLSSQISPESLAFLEVGLVLLCFLVWLVSALRPASRWRPAVGGAGLVLAAALLGMGFLGSSEAAESRIAWQPFDEGRAQELAAGGTSVFVDVTADWCLTCKFNELRVLETDEVADLFRDHGIVAMKADWTNRDAAIGSFLARHGRSSIPFYLLYRPGDEPHLFGELLGKGELRREIEALRGGPSSQIAGSGS